MIKKAMIMAAGVGSRLDPLTRKTPKPLIPIANKLIMDLILEKLSNAGIKNIVANTHFLADTIHKRYENKEHTEVNCNFVYEEKLSGTAGGVKKCEWFFNKGETFIVMSADGLTNIDINKIIDSHKASGAIVTMGLTRVPKEEVCHFGVVVTDESSKVVEFQEKPPVEEAKSNLVNTGIYVFETEIFDYIPADTFYDFAKNVFPEMLANNKTINTFVVENYWSDIGTLNQYRLSTVDVLQGKVDVNFADPETNIGWCSKTAKLNPESVKEGKVVIGEGSIVDKSAELIGYNVIGNNCIIKSNAKIKNSIIWDNVVIDNNVELENCIIADNSNITKNVKLDKDAIIAADTIISPTSEYASEIIPAK